MKEETIIITKEAAINAMQCLVDNGVDPGEAPTVLQALGYILLDIELEDYIDWDFQPIEANEED